MHFGVPKIHMNFNFWNEILKILLPPCFPSSYMCREKFPPFPYSSPFAPQFLEWSTTGASTLCAKRDSALASYSVASSFHFMSFHLISCPTKSLHLAGWLATDSETLEFNCKGLSTPLQWLHSTWGMCIVGHEPNCKLAQGKARPAHIMCMRYILYCSLHRPVWYLGWWLPWWVS